MKICIVGGCGHAATVAEAAEKGADFQVCGICPSFQGDDSTEYLINRFRKHGNEPKQYSNMTTMLNAELPDIAVVNGIFGEHAPMACYALHRGINVYCDKPAATTHEQYDQLCKAIQESGALYWSMLTSRYASWFTTAKRLVDAGTIGEIRLIDAQKSYKLGKRPAFYSDQVLYGGTISWVAIHMIDLILWLTREKCVAVSAFGSTEANGGNGSLESAVICNMQMENSILASVRADYLRPSFAETHGDDRIRIVGTVGAIEVRDDTVYLLDKSASQPQIIPNDESVPIFLDFLDAVAGKKGTNIDTCQSLYSTYVCLELTRSMREKRTIIMP